MPDEVNFFWERYKYVRSDFVARKSGGKWILDGMFKGYMWPGKLSSVGAYIPDASSPTGSFRDGVWHYYHEDGSIDKIVVWHHGRQISDRRYGPDGKLTDLWNYELDGRLISDK